MAAGIACATKEKRRSVVLMDDHPTPDSIKGAAALNKGIKLLTAIADAEVPPSARDLSDQTMLPRPTVYRLLAALTEAGLVRQSSGGHTYQLGATLVTIAHRALDQMDIRDIAHEHLLKLRDETGETVHLAVFSNDAMLYVDNIESRERVRMKCSLGVSVPLYTTAVGKAYLAFSPEDQRESALERLQLDDVTGHSITSREALRAQIADAARRGWTTDEEENERDIFCFGAPILDRRGNAVAAASISIPRFRLRPMAETAYVAPLLEATGNVSRILGYRPNLSGAGKAKAAAR
jgi:DNA-binding IclR family transcriptional regulator